MNRVARRQDDEPSRDLRRLPADRSSSRRSPRRRPVILIADDTTDIRELYALYLTSRGFIVVTAEDGAAAVQVALDHVPDVIVMDLAMPQIDGITATQRIKGHAGMSRTRVILLTGYPYNVMERVALGAGVAKLLTKPCLPQELERQIRTLLPGGRGRRAPTG